MPKTFSLTYTYTNVYVRILGEQILSIQDRLDKLIHEMANSTKAIVAGPNKMEIIGAPTLQPPPETSLFTHLVSEPGIMLVETVKLNSSYRLYKFL